LRFETSYRKEVLAYLISYRKDILAVVTSNRKEVLAAWRIQAQATRKKSQEVVDLRTQKEVLACALFWGCTVVVHLEQTRSYLGANAAIINALKGLCELDQIKEATSQ